MGFTTLLDIVGSTVIGGLLLIILMRMNMTSSQNNYDYTGERIVQQNLVDVVQLLEYDFRKIGYCKGQNQTPIVQSKAILQADSTSITYQTDLPIITSPLSDLQYGDGVIDTVHYYIGPTSELSSTPNPRDRILYRVVNHDTPKGSDLGITRFHLTYYDALGNQLGTTSNPLPSTPPLLIASIQIEVAVENSTAVIDTTGGKVAYSWEKRAMWKQIRLSQKNFSKR
jgi:type II secretory pathway component PulJ